MVWGGGTDSTLSQWAAQSQLKGVVNRHTLSLSHSYSPDLKHCGPAITTTQGQALAPRALDGVMKMSLHTLAAFF